MLHICTCQGHAAQVQQSSKLLHVENLTWKYIINHGVEIG